MIAEVLLTGAIGALAGLITNIVAIEVLFHPYNKVFGFQGFLMRDRQHLIDRIKEIAQFTPEDKSQFLALHGDEIPFWTKFFLSNMNTDKASEMGDLFIQTKFTMSKKELESFCKRWGSNEFSFIKFMGIVVGFLTGVIVGVF